MIVPKKTYLLSFSILSRDNETKIKHVDIYQFSCNSESHMTNNFSFTLSTDVEKNPGPTQSNTDSHETIIKPVMQSVAQ